MRHIVWFSAGMPSAITAMLVLEKEPSAHLVYIHIDSHHPDNWRFIRDVERWLKIKVEILQSGKYKEIPETMVLMSLLPSPSVALAKEGPRSTDNFNNLSVSGTFFAAKISPTTSSTFLKSSRVIIFLYTKINF